MEALERAVAREAQRLSSSILDPIVINSIDDVKRALVDFDPNKNKIQSEVPISVIMNSDGKTYSVNTKTKSKSKRDLLLEGLDVVKKKMAAEDDMGRNIESVTINNRQMKPASLNSGVQCHSWIDPLIKHWLGGYRNGTDICWDLFDGYHYKYDAYTHKLTRVKQNEVRPTTIG